METEINMLRHDHAPLAAMQHQMRARGHLYTEDSKLDNEFSSRIRVSRGVKYFDEQILNYDSRRLNSLGVIDGIFHRASTFSSVALWRDSLLCGLLAFGTGVGAYFFAGTHGTCAEPVDTTEIDTMINGLLPFVQNLLALLPFLLGLYLSTSLDRWWSMRRDCLGNLWGAMSDLSLLTSTYFPRPEDKEIRERVLRWALLSHTLIYKQAMNHDDLSDLIDDGVLLRDEYVRLQDQPIKAQIIWLWMVQYFSHLAYGDSSSSIPYREFILPRVHDICLQARGAIGSLFAYLDCQLPFRYVHLLSFMVWAYCVMQGLLSGFVGAGAVLNCQWTKLVFQFLYSVGFPLLFLALLHLAEHLNNPFRTTSVNDFPRGAIHRFMRDEWAAFFRAAQDPPFGAAPLWQDNENSSDSSAPSGPRYRKNAAARNSKSNPSVADEPLVNPADVVQGAYQGQTEFNLTQF